VLDGFGFGLIQRRPGHQLLAYPQQAGLIDLLRNTPDTVGDRDASIKLAAERVRLL
jgi:hypothetical protein